MNQSRQNNLIMILILIFGAAAGYFFYVSFGSSLEASVPVAAGPGRDSLGSFKNLKINFLESNIFDTFRTFGEYPVNPGSVGRKDLFAPF